MSRRGALVLVGTPIGNLGDLSPRAVEALRDADVIAAEDTRRTRNLLSHAGVPGGNRVRAIHEHNEWAAARRVVEEVSGGARVAYVTDAGMPGVSDPGARLVQACLAAGLDVEVVPGPSAVLTALVLSGLPADRFVFEGFLPRKGKERRARLATIAAEPRTVVVFEAPNRVEATVADLAATCGAERPVAIARELTKLHEEVWRGSLRDAASYGDSTSARGEYVLVIGGAPDDASAPTDDEVGDAVQLALDSGSSARDAAADVASALGVSKRRAYAAAVSRRSDRSP